MKSHQPKNSNQEFKKIALSLLDSLEQMLTEYVPSGSDERFFSILLESQSSREIKAIQGIFNATLAQSAVSVPSLKGVRAIPKYDGKQTGLIVEIPSAMTEEIFIDHLKSAIPNVRTNIDSVLSHFRSGGIS